MYHVDFGGGGQAGAVPGAPSPAPRQAAAVTTPSAGTGPRRTAVATRRPGGGPIRGAGMPAGGVSYAKGSGVTTPISAPRGTAPRVTARAITPGGPMVQTLMTPSTPPDAGTTPAPDAGAGAGAGAGADAGAGAGTTPTTQETPPPEEAKKGLPLWAWIGIGVGGIGLLGGLVYFLARKKKPAPGVPTAPAATPPVSGFGMTLREAQKEFNEEVLPFVVQRYGKDKTAIRTAWNDWTDSLQKAGRITAKQYDRWVPSAWWHK